MPSETSHAGRTGLKRHLSYDRYLQSIRRGMGAVILLQSIPFALVILSSIQSQAWIFLSAACVVLLGLISWTFLVVRKSLRPLRHSHLRIDGCQLEGRVEDKEVCFSLMELQSVDCSHDPIRGHTCRLTLRNGQTILLQTGLERFDYIIDSIIGYRPELKTTELISFRTEIVVSDHFLAHLDAYTRNRLLVFCQFAGLPIAFCWGAGFQRLSHTGGITATMMIAAIIIINMVLGFYFVTLVAWVLKRRSKRNVEADAAEIIRDLRLESTLDWLGLAAHATLILATCFWLR